jgi:hypothetical protein
MGYAGKYTHILLSVFVMLLSSQFSRMEVTTAAALNKPGFDRPAPAASYSESTRTWTLSARVLQVKEVSIYGRPGSIAQIEYGKDGKPQQTWVAIRMDDYSFSDSHLPITGGSEIVLQVSGSYVSSKGVDWAACPGSDLYCQNASFIEGGFPVSEDFGGLTVSPSNMLIHRGSVPTGDWVNGILAWKIRHNTSRHGLP